MANEKPKEGVKTENNDHINLKVAGQDGSMVRFKIKRHTLLSKLMGAYCERQGWRRIGFFDGQPISETDTPARLEMEDTTNVVQQQTQVSTEKGTCYFPSELRSSRPGRRSPLEICNLDPLHPDYYSILPSSLSFSLSTFLYCTIHKETDVYAQPFAFLKSKWPMVCFD
ncbi:LOW QUALITY PROTEIN: small ubiquitin-related modifier 2-like [Glossophaga mutica]